MCTRCNKIYNVEKHISDDGTIVKEATETDNGIKWIINGKDVKNPKDVNLKASMTDITIPAEVINKITNETKKIQIRLEHASDYIIVFDDKPYDSGNNDLPGTYDYNAAVFFLLALCAVVTAAIVKKRKWHNHEVNFLALENIK